MKRFVKAIWSVVMILGMFAVGILLADKQVLSTQLIRLRIVAASDSVQDQQLKLQVRDAVNIYLQKYMPQGINVQQAKEYLCDHLQQISNVAEDRLSELGYSAPVHVYMNREEAKLREYETFSLPSGVYDTLRIDIGEAAGENWWCVVFPALCMPETTQGFQDVAVSCGISDNLADTLAKTDSYEVRFFFLDCLGKLENLLHKS